MLYLAPGEIFENMLQLKRFGLNFEKLLILFLNGYIHIEIVISAPREKF